MLGNPGGDLATQPGVVGNDELCAVVQRSSEHMLVLQVDNRRVYVSPRDRLIEAIDDGADGVEPSIDAGSGLGIGSIRPHVAFGFFEDYVADDRSSNQLSADAVRMKSQTRIG